MTCVGVERCVSQGWPLARGVLRPLRIAEENLPRAFAWHVPTFPLSVQYHQAEMRWREQPGSTAALVLIAREKWEHATKCGLESCGWWDWGFFWAGGIYQYLDDRQVWSDGNRNSRGLTCMSEPGCFTSTPLLRKKASLINTPLFPGD